MISLDNLATTKVVIDDGSYEHKKLAIDVPEVMSRLEAADQLFHAQRQALAALENPVYDLQYEEYFSDESVAERIRQELFDFLGASVPTNVRTGRKVLSDRLEDVIENYDELAAAVAGTRFSQYLE